MRLSPLVVMDTTVLGVTGGIAMGKSTCVTHLREVFGIEAHDADEAVHRLYGPGGNAVRPVSEAFGDGVLDDDGGIDRSKLSKALTSKEDFVRLEAIVHPLVTMDREDFVESCRDRGRALAVVDIPLLFETGVKVDFVLTVSCDAREQRRRALQRPRMTEAKLDSILGRQLEDEERRRKADFVVDTNYEDTSVLKSQLANVLETLWKAPASPPSQQPREALAISFDLDDTLWPTLPPLKEAAAEALELWPSVLPKSFEALGPDEAAAFFRNFKTEFRRNAPSEEIADLLRHDITAQRQIAFRALATRYGDDPDGGDLVVKTLVDARSEATDRYVEESSLDAVKFFKERGMPVGALTNGNAQRAGRFGELFDFWLTAADVGAAKPSVAPFLAAAHSSRCSVQDLVHVGDSLNDDVRGALKAGARAVLVSQDDAPELPDDVAKSPRFLLVASVAQVPIALTEAGWISSSGR